MKQLLFFLGLAKLVNDVLSYNILLVFPHPGKSHAILGEGYVRHLLKAGHEVTYITPFPVKAHPKLKQVDVSSDIVAYQNDLRVLDFKALLTGENIIDDLSYLYELSLVANNRSIQNENVQKFLRENEEKYDIAIIQWFNAELNVGFAAALNIPYIWASSYEHQPAMLSFIDELQNPACFRNNLSPVSPPLTFRERVNELWELVNLILIRWRIRDKAETAYRLAFSAAAKKRGVNLPTLEEFIYRSSLMFGNAHAATGDANKLPQNYIPIGGFHIDDEVKPLPEKFQKIMDEAKDGVIYFSMGSNTKSTTMPQEMKRDLLNVFSKLKQTVIWKYEEDLENIPKNVHIVHWAPQQSILAHRNCKLFITHGGLLSITEALHFGVPIIGIPLFVDHFVNMMRAANKGFAIEINLGYDLPAKLKVAIEEIFSNPQYSQKAEEFSFIYHHRPIKPGAAMTHWVEHVIKTKANPYLQSPALHVPFYQKLYLDLLAVIIISTFVLLRIVNNILGELKNNTLKKER